MSKIVIKDTKKGALLKARMCPERLIHLLTTALVSAVNNFDAVKDKEDFLRIMGLYYDDAK